jgi:hypothetical protein
MICVVATSFPFVTVDDFMGYKNATPKHLRYYDILKREDDDEDDCIGNGINLSSSFLSSAPLFIYGTTSVQVAVLRWIPFLLNPAIMHFEIDYFFFFDVEM